EIPTTFSAMQYHTYEMEDGFYRPSEGAISWATRPELARLLPGDFAPSLAVITLPSYRDFRGGFAWHIPLWPFFGLPIACWCVETGRLRRFLRKGLCPSCGYDLRGGGDRCPECGANVPTGMVSAQSKCELREREADGDVSPRPPHC
ncbi:MAG: hypothetical protein KDA33_07255, partial [Phycisphaerales bacterium]|nr:hypothetical protein [Phycisphaerales bacterium]